MIRTSRWKLIRYPKMNRTQLFDLENDPDELVDLSTSSKHTELIKKLGQQLDHWLDQQTR